MAKQRRARSRPGTSKPAASTPRAAVRPKSSTTAPGASRRAEQGRQPITRTSYVQAVAVYERGLAALQAHEYARAGDLLRSVLATYPEEKDLHERVRLYLTICERQAAPRESTPQSAEERVYAATLAVNAGKYDQALQLLRDVAKDDPENDHALYMLAVVQVLRGKAEDAVPHLLRAIDLNPENRALARQDPDLEALRQNPTVRTTLDTTGRTDRRRPARNRRSR